LIYHFREWVSIVLAFLKRTMVVPCSLNEPGTQSQIQGRDECEDGEPGRSVESWDGW
jgi:hypothetical protein